MRSTFWSAASTVALALLGTACCWGPPVAIALLGSGAAWASALEPYHNHLLAFTALQLALGFYFAYRKPKACTNPNHHHGDPMQARKLKIGIMWGVAAFVVALNLATLPAHSHPTKMVGHVHTDMRHASLKVEGMHCQGCAMTIEDSLASIPGVHHAEVSFEKGTVELDLEDPAPTRMELESAIRKAGYRVALK